MQNTEQERAEWRAWQMAKIEQSMELEKRFAALFGESAAGVKARRARELLMNGDVTTIPAAQGARLAERRPR